MSQFPPRFAVVRKRPVRLDRAKTTSRPTVCTQTVGLLVSDSACRIVPLFALTRTRLLSAVSAGGFRGSQVCIGLRPSEPGYLRAMTGPLAGTSLKGTTLPTLPGNSRLAMTRNSTWDFGHPSVARGLQPPRAISDDGSKVKAS